MSNEEGQEVPIQQEDIDIQHDDEFEDFKVADAQEETADNKAIDPMDDWDDDKEENFTSILKKERETLH